MALPLVLVLGVGSQLTVGLLLELTRHDIGAAPALTHAAQSLADAEQTLKQASARLAGTLAFPAAGCGAGLCANRQAPPADSYDWLTGSAHTPLPGLTGAGYWIESLGTVQAGQSADCSGSNGGCEYVRLVASAAAGGIRRSLEACYRIRRASNAAPEVTRLSWRQTHAP